MFLDLKRLLSHLPTDVDRHDTFLLLQHVLKIPYEKLFFTKEINITDQEFIELDKYLHLRSIGMPIAKIVEHKAFYNNEFKTTIDTLDPRPETELIVDLFLKYFPYKSAHISILDLGCGTGCIGLSIIDLYPNATLCLADISEEALAVAEDNAKNTNLKQRCSFIKTDWFKNINGQFDAIVCNPPYIENGYQLDKSTLYDPHIALFGGNDGLEAYKEILPCVRKFLRSDGFLFLEIGIGQRIEVCKIAKSTTVIEIAKDLQGIERTIVFCNG